MRAQGEAEAEIIFKKGEAEAKAMNVKAEAYQEYNQAAVVDKLITAMPEMVRALAAPLANVDKITIVSTGNGDAAGMNKITGDMTKMAAQIPALFETLSGMQMSELFGKVRSIGEKTPKPDNDDKSKGKWQGAKGNWKEHFMALLERVATLVRANLNDLIDKAEEPEKMIKQVILDMQNQLMQVKTQVAISIADQHLLEKKQKENHDKTRRVGAQGGAGGGQEAGRPGAGGAGALDELPTDGRELRSADRGPEDAGREPEIGVAPAGAEAGRGARPRATC